MKKQPLTMIELFLVMAIIALAMGGLGISLPKALKKERFKNSKLEVLSKIELATDLMLAYDTDVILSFHKANAGICCNFITSKNLPPRIKKTLNNNEIITEVTDIQLDGKHTPLYFSAATQTPPCGKLMIKGEKEELFDLPALPTPSLQKNHVKKKIKAPYPEEVLSPS